MILWACVRIFFPQTSCGRMFFPDIQSYSMAGILLQDFFVLKIRLQDIFSEITSNYTQVLCEFYVPKNLFHMLPRVLKAYFESLDTAF